MTEITSMIKPDRLTLIESTKTCNQMINEIMRRLGVVKSVSQLVNALNAGKYIASGHVLRNKDHEAYVSSMQDADIENIPNDKEKKLF